MQAAADRLTAKLEALDLDTDERAVLEGMLGAGATSIERTDSEVQGFAIDTFIWFDSAGGGVAKGEPTASVSLNFTKVSFKYTPQA